MTIVMTENGKRGFMKANQNKLIYSISYWRIFYNYIIIKILIVITFIYSYIIVVYFLLLIINK